MWEKLAWNVEELEDIQRMQNDEFQPLCYAFLDACITAQCLQHWVLHHLGMQGKEKSKAFEAELYTRMPDQLMCVSIANSAKHAHYSGDWSGVLELVFEPSDEDVQGGWSVRHIYPGSEERLVTVGNLRELCFQWFNLLVERGLVHGPYTSPAWFSNKMRRIFGNWDLPEQEPL
ncbi:hypothetical protein G6N76_01420 [Rhizobium daejeonense]|uniref:Uncharacterized protein n=1 Tax=Rhizobium daejeonense TaxID=240521 RepID=A0A6M1RZB5_9HYPH|nr:hypothetical protein [Rhizobium daejeonense]NGO62317.1 hypothetical protein [Rhizobium daejeonense]